MDNTRHCPECLRLQEKVDKLQALCTKILDDMRSYGRMSLRTSTILKQVVKGELIGN